MTLTAIKSEQKNESKKGPIFDPSAELVAAAVAKQATLAAASSDLRAIEEAVAEIGAEAERSAAQRSAKLAELRRRREDAVASGVLGADFQGMVDEIDREMSAILGQLETRNLSDASAGLERRLTAAKEQLAAASDAERLARDALLEHHEQEHADAMDRAGDEYEKQLLIVKGFAEFRGSYGVEGLSGGSMPALVMPSAVKSRRETPRNVHRTVRLTSWQFHARLSEEKSRITEEMKKHGLVVDPDAVASLQGRSKKSYTVLEPIRHDGTNYAPGARIELTDQQSTQLLELKAIAHIEPSSQTPSRAAEAEAA